MLRILYLCGWFLFFHALVVWADVATPVSAECKKFVDSLPPSSIHGWVEVPEDWSHPRGKKIQVFYYGFHFKELPQISPLVYYNGGPGGEVHRLNAYLEKKPDYTKIPFLFIDQRGTGCSSPFPRQEFTKEGVERVALYGARAIVRDSEQIRKTVFHGRKWRIFGQSYGSFIVHRYVELAPRGLIAAFGHGAALMTDGIRWTEDRTRAFKRVGDEYFKVHPEDRETIQRARALFPKTYCQVSDLYKICGAPILDDLGWSYLSFKDFGYWDRLHSEIGKLFLSTGRLDMDFIRERFSEKFDAGNLVLLVDVVPARESPGGFCNTWSCELAIPRMEARGEHPMDYEFNECRNALAIERNFDYGLVKEVVQDDYAPLGRFVFHLRTHPKLKFFLYSGHLDTFGPEESFQQEVKRLGRRITYRAYPSGHGSYFEEPQTWKDILSTQ